MPINVTANLVHVTAQMQVQKSVAAIATKRTTAKKIIQSLDSERRLGWKKINHAHSQHCALWEI